MDKSQHSQEDHKDPAAFSGTPANHGRFGIVVEEDIYSGPLPDPQTLAKYNAVVPGAAQTIIEMAKLEQEHRHRQEESNNLSMIQDIVAERRERARGQWMAFCFAIIAISIGSWLIVQGQTLAGSIFAGGCIVAIVSSFLKTDIKKSEYPAVKNDLNGS